MNGPAVGHEFNPKKPEMTAIYPVETSRTYIFPNNERVTFHDVKALAVSVRGTHRLECKEGKVIVAPGWLAIILNVTDWTL